MIRGSEGNVVGTSTVTNITSVKRPNDAWWRSTPVNMYWRVDHARCRSKDPSVLCESLRSGRGFWNLDRPADVLRCVQTWHVPRCAQFEEVARQHLLPAA